MTTDLRARFREEYLMSDLQHEFLIRVRYSETDQMGTFYNSRPLEWFECGRTELFRHQLDPLLPADRHAPRAEAGLPRAQA